MTSMGIGREIVGSIVSKTDDVLKILKESSDPRMSYSSLAKLRTTIKYVPEFQDSPEIRFATFVFWAVIGSGTWGKIPEGADDWMVSSRGEMEELIQNTIVFLESVRKAFESDEADILLDASKDFLYKDVDLRGRLPPTGSP